MREKLFSSKSLPLLDCGEYQHHYSGHRLQLFFKKSYFLTFVFFLDRGDPQLNYGTNWCHEPWTTGIENHRYGDCLLEKEKKHPQCKWREKGPLRGSSLVSTLERHWHGVAIHEDHLSSYIKLHDIHKRNPRHLIKQAKFVWLWMLNLKNNL